MPLKLNIGLTKKLGLPDYGSVGASCHVELELPHDAMTDLEAFQQHVRSAYTACRQAVQDELSRHAGGQGTGAGNDAAATTNGHTNGHSNGSHQGNGQRRSTGRKATASQVRAIHAIINRQGLDLVGTLRERCGVEYTEDLSISQASELIDHLKAQANGTGGGR